MRKKYIYMNEQVEALAKPETLPGLDLLCSFMLRA